MVVKRFDAGGVRRHRSEADVSVRSDAQGRGRGAIGNPGHVDKSGPAIPQARNGGLGDVAEQKDMMSRARELIAVWIPGAGSR